MIENEEHSKEAIIKIGIVIEFHLINPIIIIISLAKLIVGGADILIAVKINHQNVMFGEDVNNPLKEIIFRVWNFI